MSEVTTETVREGISEVSNDIFIILVILVVVFVVVAVVIDIVALIFFFLFFLSDRRFRCLCLSKSEEKKKCHLL